MISDFFAVRGTPRGDIHIFFVLSRELILKMRNLGRRLISLTSRPPETGAWVGADVFHRHGCMGRLAIIGLLIYDSVGRR